MKTRYMAAIVASAFLICGLSAAAQTRPAAAKKPAARKATPAKPAETPNARPMEPKLVLLLVVDQFRADYLDRFHKEYTGGLKRLLDNSAVFADAHYNHSPTVTAVGHSITLTGAMPSSSGIVGNEWYDRPTGRQVTSVSDPSTKQIGRASCRETVCLGV